MLRCKPRLSALFLMFSLLLFHMGNACSEQNDPSYEDFLVQRMRIAKIRILQGEVSAGTLLTSLKQEANKIGMQLPDWLNSALPKKGLKCNPRLQQDCNSKKFDPIIQKAAGSYGLPFALIKAVIRAESAFIKDAKSNKGAQGLMQLMPATADELDVQNAFDPRANILGGSRLIRRYLDKYGSLKKTLIAYNAGPGWVGRRRGIPRETRIYIARVIKFYRLYKRENQQ